MQKFARVVEHVGTEKFNDLQAPRSSYHRVGHFNELKTKLSQTLLMRRMAQLLSFI